MYACLIIAIIIRVTDTGNVSCDMKNGVCSIGLLLFIVKVLLQNYKALQDGGQGNIWQGVKETV